MQPSPATVSDRPPFDAHDWIKRARQIDMHLQAMPGGLYRSIPGGDDPAAVHRAAEALDAELLDLEAHCAVWRALIEWAER